MRRSAAFAGCAIWIAAAPLAASPQFSVALPDAAAAALALGGAQVAFAEGALATAWNPAGLAWLRGGDVMLSHRELEAGWARQDGALALRCRTRRGVALGLQGTLLRQPGKPASEATRPGTPPQAAYRATLQSALQLRPEVAFGVALGAYADLPIAGVADKGWVADAGLQWRRANSFVGAAVRGVRFGGDSAASPVISLGLAQAMQENRALWTFQVDRVEKEYRTALGLALRSSSRSVLRAGVERPSQSGEWIGSGGLGLAVDRMNFDYACRAGRDMHPEHVLSFGVGLGAVPMGPDPAWMASEPKAPREDRDRDARAARPAPVPPVATAPAPLAPPPAAVAPLAPPPRQPAAPGPTTPKTTTPKTTPPKTTTPRATTPSEDTSPRAVAVIAGPYPNLEAAARDILRLRGVDLHPAVETRAEKYFILVQSCPTRVAAEGVRSRAASCGVSCRVEDE